MTMSPTTDDLVVAALLRVASEMDDVEHANLGRQFEPRSQESAVALAIIAEHGYSTETLVPLKGLARSRGVDLETVLRASIHNDLRAIVQLPPVSSDQPG
jgi:hypothetical protein